MGHPGTVVAVACFPLLVGLDFRESLSVCLFVIFDWYLRRHSAHGVNAPAMTSLDAKQRIRTHEMCRHGHEGPVCQDKVWIVPETLDAAENIIPPATIQAG